MGFYFCNKQYERDKRWVWYCLYRQVFPIPLLTRENTQYFNISIKNFSERQDQNESKVVFGCFCKGASRGQGVTARVAGVLFFFYFYRKGRERMLRTSNRGRRCELGPSCSSGISYGKKQ